MLANNNEVAGLFISEITESPAILGIEIKNTFLHDNVISQVQTAEGLIYLENCSDNLVFNDNTVTNGTSTAIGIHILTTQDSLYTFASFEGNSIDSMATIGVQLQNNGRSALNSFFSDNTISNNGTNAIRFYQRFEPGTMCTKVENNTISSNGTIGILALISNGSLNAQIQDNTISNSGLENLFFFCNESNICLELNGNTATNLGLGNYDYALINNSGTFNFETPHVNTGTLRTSGVITQVLPGTCNCSLSR
jgi:hypothetical protein